MRHWLALSLSFFLLIVVTRLSCGQSADTINAIVFEGFRPQHQAKRLNLVWQEDVVWIGKKMNNEGLFDERAHEILDSLGFKKGGLYFIFSDRKGRRIEEGIWAYEFFTGPYKLYHRNGRLKEMGNLLEGNKTGLWKFYDRKGQLIREEEYPLYEDKKH